MRITSWDSGIKTEIELEDAGHLEDVARAFMLALLANGYTYVTGITIHKKGGGSLSTEGMETG